MAYNFLAEAVEDIDSYLTDAIEDKIQAKRRLSIVRAGGELG